MDKLNIQPFLDNAKFNAFHKNILLWCAFILVFDGYDLVIYGTVLPILMKNWALTPVQAGSLASYALFGMMFGAFIFGTIANRIGQKKAIIACVALFSGFTFLCGFAQNSTIFAFYRFMAGLGIGGVMPNVISLMAEYSPKSIRSTLVTTMFSGYAVGGIMSALLGIFLIPRMGWESIFYVGLLPLLLLPIIMRYLPESLSFLVKNGKMDEAKAILAKVEPSYTPQNGTDLEVTATVAGTTGINNLFTNNRLLSTVMFWVAFFCSLLTVYGLNSWLTKLIMTKPEFKDNLGLSLTFLLVLNIGGIFGAIGGGRLGDKYDLRKTVIGFFLMGSAAIGLLGFSSSLGMYILMFFAGAATIGNQIVLNTLVAQFYPALLRSTGIGWASGVGRIGAIIGPIFGGVLVGWKLPFEQNFFAFAIPAIIGAIAITFVDYRNEKV
jgi:MFS transporter, AAHS family, benzoate transport protein